MTVESARGLLSSVIDESTWGQAIKKAAVYSIDNGYKHIQGAEFKMTYLGEENAIFAQTLAINLELMGNPGCTFKFVSTYTHTQNVYLHTYKVIYCFYNQYRTHGTHNNHIFQPNSAETV